MTARVVLATWTSPAFPPFSLTRLSCLNYCMKVTVAPFSCLEPCSGHRTPISAVKVRSRSFSVSAKPGPEAPERWGLSSPTHPQGGWGAQMVICAFVSLLLRSCFKNALTDLWAFQSLFSFPVILDIRGGTEGGTERWHNYRNKK